MTVSLPMCAIDFTNDAMGPEEAAIADRKTPSVADYRGYIQAFS